MEFTRWIKRPRSTLGLIEFVPLKRLAYTELKGIATTYTNNSLVRVYQNLSGLKVKRLLLTKKNQKAFSMSR